MPLLLCEWNRRAHCISGLLCGKVFFMHVFVLLHYSMLEKAYKYFHAACKLLEKKGKLWEGEKDAH